jgi:hypothetical protein
MCAEVSLAAPGAFERSLTLTIAKGPSRSIVECFSIVQDSHLVIHSMQDIEPSKAVKRTADKQPNSLASMIKIKPQPKKQKLEREQTGLHKSEESKGVEKSVSNKSEAPVAQNLTEKRIEQPGGLLGLQTYGSDDDEDDHPDK